MRRRNFLKNPTTVTTRLILALRITSNHPDFNYRTYSEEGLIYNFSDSFLKA